METERAKVVSKAIGTIYPALPVEYISNLNAYELSQLRLTIKLIRNAVLKNNGTHMCNINYAMRYFDCAISEAQYFVFKSIVNLALASNDDDGMVMGTFSTFTTLYRHLNETNCFNMDTIKAYRLGWLALVYRYIGKQLKLKERSI